MADLQAKVLVSWSGGRDSAMALHALRSSGEHDVAGLLTTVRQEDATVAMHGVPRELIERQAAALDMPLTIVELPGGASNVVYEHALAMALAPMLEAGVRSIAFGDLFLADIRAYREQVMQRLGFAPIFPIWRRDTHAFVEEFTGMGFQAIVVAVDPSVLEASFAGRQFDPGFVADLPVGVDPCGERGEFHTFVFDGPGFREPIALALGDRHVRDGLCLQAIRLAASAENSQPTVTPASAPR